MFYRTYTKTIQTTKSLFGGAYRWASTHCQAPEGTEQSKIYFKGKIAKSLPINPREIVTGICWLVHAMPQGGYMEKVTWKWHFKTADSGCILVWLGTYPLLLQQHNCQLVNCMPLLPLFSLIIGRGDQGGWEEEVITTRLWGSTWGIIKGKDIWGT